MVNFKYFWGFKNYANIVKNFVLAILLTLLLIPASLAGQKKSNLGPYTMFEQMIFPQKQARILSYLADDCARGRSVGTLAHQNIGKYIRDHFEQYGLKPFQGHYYQHFMCDSVKVGRNVVGFIPSIIPSDKYVIISAHYDHIGALNGFVYNGADDNASGVTALLNLAEMFGSMYKAKMGPDKNIIFVAFDAKEMSMAGSRHFVKNLNISKEKIVCNINMDQIGSTLEPVHEGISDYLIILGENTLAKEHRGKLGICNRFYNINLDIDYTFYSSKAFTELYYKLSDQVAFEEAGIPALLLTSGFHKHTYKITDDLNIISYPVLKKRSVLVFYFVMML